MAPEQLEGKEADTRSDIFSFGAIVYEMIDRQAGVRGNSSASVIAAILDREPRADVDASADDAACARSCREQMSRKRSGRPVADRA